MKYNPQKLQMGNVIRPINSVDNPVIIDYFKKNPLQLSKFAGQMNSTPQNSMGMITDNKWGPYHEAANKFIMANPVTPTRVDSMDYVNPRTRGVMRTNSIEFAKNYPGKTPQQLGAQYLGMSKLNMQ